MAKRERATYTLLSRYIVKEFLLSFLVAFLFFFFIFFINQLLLLAQKILIRQVKLSSVLFLVFLAIPQILLYTLPFSTMSASSMTLGELAGANEILALRTSAISMRRIYTPLLIAALVLSLLTFAVADVLLPLSSKHYQQAYNEILQELPTLELDSYAINQVGSTILITGEVKQGEIDDLILLDLPMAGGGVVVSAAKAKLTLLDVDNLLYRLELYETNLLETDAKSQSRFSFSQAEEITYYLDFSTQIQRLTDIRPSQLSSRTLRTLIAERRQEQELAEEARLAEQRALAAEVAELGQQIIHSDDPQLLQEFSAKARRLQSAYSARRINFYLQYYLAEFHKKMALSAACLFLVLISFPLALFRIRHGRLLGFGLSLLVSSAYWFGLFFAQTKILDVAFNPGFLIWAPDAIVFVIALVLMYLGRRS